MSCPARCVVTLCEVLRMLSVFKVVSFSTGMTVPPFCKAAACWVQVFLCCYGIAGLQGCWVAET